MLKENHNSQNLGQLVNQDSLTRGLRPTLAVGVAVNCQKWFGEYIHAFFPQEDGSQIYCERRGRISSKERVKPMVAKDASLFQKLRSNANYCIFNFII